MLLDDDAARVEAACTAMAAAGGHITFTDVAERSGVSRTTLYRQRDLRAVVEEHRARGREANTPSGLAIQVDQRMTPPTRRSRS